MTRPSRDTTAGRIYLDLRAKARTEGRGTDELLVPYVLERFLYRLSISEHRDRFVLKGGMLLAAFDERRPTRDVDLLGLAITNDTESVAARCGFMTPGALSLIIGRLGSAPVDSGPEVSVLHAMVALHPVGAATGPSRAEPPWMTTPSRARSSPASSSTSCPRRSRPRHVPTG